MDRDNQSAFYDASRKTYAVFDWDNTSIINDIGEVAFVYQLENLNFKLNPEELKLILYSNISGQNCFPKDQVTFDNTSYVARLVLDILKDYRFLYENYISSTGRY